jgi:transcriptional regulator with XRE-family HTH domain
MSAIDKAFGKAVRKYRQQLDLSQEDLAHIAGVHRTYVSQIERGIKSPSIKVVLVLAQALEVSMRDLIGEAENILAGNMLDE